MSKSPRLAAFCDVMPKPLAQITAEYLESPPTILAIQTSDWDTITSAYEDPGVPLSNSQKLTSTLLKKHRYESVDQGRDFILMRRRPDSAFLGHQ